MGNLIGRLKRKGKAPRRNPVVSPGSTSRTKPEEKRKKSRGINEVLSRQKNKNKKGGDEKDVSDEAMAKSLACKPHQTPQQNNNSRQRSPPVPQTESKNIHTNVSPPYIYTPSTLPQMKTPNDQRSSNRRNFINLTSGLKAETPGKTVTTNTRDTNVITAYNKILVQPRNKPTNELPPVTKVNTHYLSNVNTTTTSSKQNSDHTFIDIDESHQKVTNKDLRADSCIVDIHNDSKKDPLPSHAPMHAPKNVQIAHSALCKPILSEKCNLVQSTTTQHCYKNITRPPYQLSNNTFDMSTHLNPMEVKNISGQVKTAQKPELNINTHSGVLEGNNVLPRERDITINMEPNQTKQMENVDSKVIDLKDQSIKSQEFHLDLPSFDRQPVPKDSKEAPSLSCDKFDVELPATPDKAQNTFKYTSYADYKKTSLSTSDYRQQSLALNTTDEHSLARNYASTTDNEFKFSLRKIQTTKQQFLAGVLDQANNDLTNELDIDNNLFLQDVNNKTKEDLTQENTALDDENKYYQLDKNKEDLLDFEDVMHLIQKETSLPYKSSAETESLYTSYSHSYGTSLSEAKYSSNNQEAINIYKTKESTNNATLMTENERVTNKGDIYSNSNGSTSLPYESIHIEDNKALTSINEKEKVNLKLNEDDLNYFTSQTVTKPNQRCSLNHITLEEVSSSKVGIEFTTENKESTIQNHFEKTELSLTNNENWESRTSQLQETKINDPRLFGKSTLANETDVNKEAAITSKSCNILKNTISEDSYSNTVPPENKELVSEDILKESKQLMPSKSQDNEFIEQELMEKSKLELENEKDNFNYSTNKNDTFIDNQVVKKEVEMRIEWHSNNDTILEDKSSSIVQPENEQSIPQDILKSSSIINNGNLKRIPSKSQDNEFIEQKLIEKSGLSPEVEICSERPSIVSPETTITMPSFLKSRENIDEETEFFSLNSVNDGKVDNKETDSVLNKQVLDLKETDRVPSDITVNANDSLETLLTNKVASPKELLQEKIIPINDQFTEYSDVNPTDLVDDLTNTTISRDAYNSVITSLKNIQQKALPFQEEIKKFTELENSNKHYYIEESLRRLIDKLDDMYEEIGEVNVLRDARKMVYKCIFPMFEWLDDKVQENRMRIQNEKT